MHSIYLDVYRQTDSRTLLRKMDATRHIIDANGFSIRKRIDFFVAPVLVCDVTP